MESADSATPVIMCTNLSRRYDTGSEIVVAVDDVSFSAEAATFLALVGPSGSGKSTLLALLGCVDRPTAGTVTIGGVDVTTLSRRDRRRIRRTTAATMLPAPADNLSLHRTGVQNIADAARHRGVGGADTHALASDLGIDGFTDQITATMSGGEQQRVALACALIGGTPIVLADEPTGALDAASAADMISALRRASHQRGTTVIVATHDPSVVEAADHVIHLTHGRLDSS